MSVILIGRKSFIKFLPNKTIIYNAEIYSIALLFLKIFI
jgi:hypothetical protein